MHKKSGLNGRLRGCLAGVSLSPHSLTSVVGEEGLALILFLSQKSLDALFSVSHKRTQSARALRL